MSEINLPVARITMAAMAFSELAANLLADRAEQEHSPDEWLSSRLAAALAAASNFLMEGATADDFNACAETAEEFVRLTFGSAARKINGGFRSSNDN